METDEFIERLMRYEDRLTRLCISMVTHGRAYADTRIHRIFGGTNEIMKELIGRSLAEAAA